MFNVVLCSVIFLLFFNSSKCLARSIADDDDLVITLPQGKIRGHELRSENDNVYYAFQQIPYASPPVGNLRFKAPVAPEHWDGVLETTKNTKICYQQNPAFPTANVTETEDCLYLNVYTPQNPNDPETLLPVFVWIHGGAYKFGDGTFQQIGPKYFIDYGIIIVAINYRLGPLGFLTTEDGVIPGNLGLKDQNFALQWIKKNINLFGGDPEKITIAGESAGGSSVGYQLISKKSKDLFRGVILQSGTAICSFGRQPFARYLAFQVGQAIDPNFSSENSTDLLNLLMNASAADIISANVDLPKDIQSAALLWAPVVEDEGEDGAFITSPMHEDIKNGDINLVPIIIGFNSEEEISFISGGIDSLKQTGVIYDKHPYTIINFVFNMTDENKELAGNEIIKIYTDDSFEDDFGALVRYASDSTFTTPALRHADLQSKYTDVYIYQMSYKGQLGSMMVDIEGVDPSGVGHAEDLKYIWDDSLNSDVSKYPEEDILTRNRILKMWSNFVKYLNPTPEEDDLLQNVTWPKVSDDSLVYLNINATLAVKTDPKEYKKWKKVIDAYAIPPLIVY